MLIKYTSINQKIHTKNWSITHFKTESWSWISFSWFFKAAIVSLVSFNDCWTSFISFRFASLASFTAPVNINCYQNNCNYFGNERQHHDQNHLMNNSAFKRKPLLIIIDNMLISKFRIHKFKKAITLNFFFCL